MPYLNGIADEMVGISQGFYGNARSTRRNAQWANFKMQAILGGFVGLVLLWLLWPWLTGR